AIGELARRGEARDLAVGPQPGAMSGSVRQGMEHCLGGLMAPAIRLDELNRGLEALDRNLGEAPGHLLPRRVLDTIAGDGAPARDPGAAEAAIPVEDEQWPAHARSVAAKRPWASCNGGRILAASRPQQTLPRRILMGRILRCAGLVLALTSTL